MSCLSCKSVSGSIPDGGRRKFVFHTTRIYYTVYIFISIKLDKSKPNFKNDFFKMGMARTGTITLPVLALSLCHYTIFSLVFRGKFTSIKQI
jgi:hypothetical protein